MRGLLVAAVLLGLTQTEAGARDRDLAIETALPRGVPSVLGWERVAGEADFGNPDFSVRYEFFVRPGRAGAYEVVRYHFTGPGAAHYAVNERLQWDVNGREVRRYECLPQLPVRGGGPPGEGAPCTWRELARDTAAYRNEARVVLWLYDLHRRLRAARDAGELPN